MGVEGNYRYVDKLQTSNVNSYSEVNLNYFWNVEKNIRFSLTGNNLLNPDHQEDTPSFLWYRAANVQRSVFGKVTIGF